MRPNLSALHQWRVFVTPSQPAPGFLPAPLGVISALLSDSLPHLHAFAVSVGLDQAWFKGEPGALPYYSLTKSMRLRCTAFGALPITPSDVELLRDYWRSHPLAPLDASPPRTSRILFPYQ